MKELSLNILDIAENSLKAGSTLTGIEISENGDRLSLTITDNGCGMSEDTLKTVIDPFYTTRTTRKVGMGLPLLKMVAEMSGGGLSVESRWVNDFPDSHGTVVRAEFVKSHIDFVPLGDVTESIITLIQGHPDSDFVFSHIIDGERAAGLDTRELREILGDLPLNSYEIISWIREYLNEQYGEYGDKKSSSQ